MKPVLVARKRIAALREQAALAERAAFDHAEMLILGDKPQVVADRGAGEGVRL